VTKTVSEPDGASEERIRIRRSDGRIQYVTRAELDELNLQRKLRDQRNGGRLVTGSPRSRMLGWLIAGGLGLLLGTLALTA
jgi:hypothetical protein